MTVDAMNVAAARRLLAERLGDLIRTTRLERDDLQTAVRDRLDLAQGYLSKIESGQFVPGLELATKIARALELDEQEVRRMTLQALLLKTLTGQRYQDAALTLEEVLEAMEGLRGALEDGR